MKRGYAIFKEIGDYTLRAVEHVILESTMPYQLFSEFNGYQGMLFR